MNNFNDKPEVHLGNYGEQIVREYLEKNGFLVYKSLTDASHPVDFITISKNFRIDSNNCAIRLCEVKTKQYWEHPETKDKSTGFNDYNLIDYLDIQKRLNTELFIYFVDSKLGKVYGNFINNLIKPVNINGKDYPLKVSNPYNNSKQLLFPLDKMIDIFILNQEQITTLINMRKENLNNRN